MKDINDRCSCLNHPPLEIGAISAIPDWDRMGKAIREAAAMAVRLHLALDATEHRADNPQETYP